MKRLKVFFFPHAGGSASQYLSWKKYINENIEVLPVELAGRGKRIEEPFYINMEQAVSDIYSKICDEIEEGDYAIYGHSMGTILAYELARKIRANKKNEPVHIFVSGRFAPYVEGSKTMLYKLSDEKFIQNVMEHGGTNKEIFDNKELLSIFLPILRADYKLVETYKHEGEIIKLNCGISILNGSQDEYIFRKEQYRWQECTLKKCNFYEFEGGHFFINQYKKEISEIINNTLISFYT